MPVTASTYPVNLLIEGRPCLVVGGGPVALHKAGGLARCRARLTVVAPAFSTGFGALVAEGLDVTLERRRYRAGEAARYRLVVTATGVPAIDRLVFADGEAAGVFVNAADDLKGCSFILPAVHRDGPVAVAVSTGGASPALAGWLRDRLAGALPSGAGELARLVGAARAALPPGAVGRASWRELFEGGLADLVAAGRTSEATRVLEDFLAAARHGDVTSAAGG